MNTKIFTFLFVALFVLFCASAFGQSTSVTDNHANYVVNPTPHNVHSNYEDAVIEEIFGLNQNQFGPSGTRGRGNIYFINNPRKLVQIGEYLNPTAAAVFYWCVYEGASQQGTYNLVLSPQQTGQGPGEGWYYSPLVDYDFVNGMYYGIWLQWDVPANYWNENPVSGTYPIPASFGELQSGVGWNWAPTYGDPPPATQSVAETFVDPVAYYQSIFTDDLIPVELTSFTYTVSGNDVTLNWQTATETNNLGFEAQRSVNGEFHTIGFVEGHGTTTENQSYSFVDTDLKPGTYSYRLKQVDMDGSYNYYDELIIEVEAPDAYSLMQNYPNPFNPSTKITYSLAVDSRVTLTVYNLLGETVTTLVNSNVPAGEQNINFDASGLNSGVYFYRLDAVGNDGSEFTSIKKMILTK